MALAFMKNLKMANMRDKDKLRKLVQLIGDIIKIEGNEWLIDEMLTIIGENSQFEQIAKNSLIQNIYEYCIEEVLEVQASEFYAKFPIQEIKDQLIVDYKKMEHERRQNDFDNFCLHMYQQIENISNYLFYSKIEKNWESKKNKIAIKSEYNEDKRQYEYPKFDGTTVEKLVFENRKDRIWYANRIFRAVLYFFYYNKEITQSDFNFNSISYAWNEIYQVRNKNHRGSKISEYQKKTLEKVMENESRVYFKFYGFLQDFVSNIEDNLNNSYKSSNQNSSKKSTHKKKATNTLGDNPKLKGVLEKLKEGY